MESARFQFLKYYFDEVQLNYKNLDEPEFKVDFDVNGLFNPQTSKYLLTFIFKALTSKCEAVKIVCHAEFHFENVDDINNIPDYFYPNSIAIVFPYIRAFISSVTLLSNIKPIILPTYNLTSLQSQLRDNTIVSSN